MRFPKRGFTFVLALWATLLFGAATGARAAVTLVVSPETLTVAPGATFTLTLQVPVTGSSFNGYDAVVEYDPAKLTFLPTNPITQQEGASMRAACPNTFFVFSAAGDSLSISHVLLCNGATLGGPSQLCVLKFRASNAPGATWVRLRNVQFYSEGLFVNPAITRDALVKWGVVLDVPPAGPPLEVRLGVRNNPSRSDQWIDADSPVSGFQDIQIFDPAGRVVRHLDSGFRSAGTRSIPWDGRDDAGRKVSPGIYRIRFEAAGRRAGAALVRLP